VACIAAPACLLALHLIRGTGDPTCRRCPQCAYDLTATQGRICPECGHAAPLEAALFARRRRTWKLVITTTVASHEVRHYTKTDPEDFGERIVITRAGQPPIAIEDFKLTLGSAMAGSPTLLGIGEDITGDGIPDLAIVGFSGGAHCCLTLHVIEHGPTLRTIAQIDLANGGVLIPTDSPGIAELIASD